jgi:2-methylisocitrate lyase-like PEP mutase family enzyme
MEHSQLEKANIFRALHEHNTTFVIPNPWDAGTSRLLAQMGFEALATTSAGAAYAAGQPDGAVGRDAMLSHIAAIAAAVDLPVSADLENGYSDAPEQVALTIRLAAAAGVVGGSIEDATGEDATGHADAPIYEINLAVDRIKAAVEAAHALNFPFTLTARCENFLHGRPDLDDTILRLRAYQEAGADVLYAPGLTRLEDIAAVIRSVDRPVNVLAGPSLTVADLAKLGVRRVSVGSALARATLTGFLAAAHEMRDHGTFSYAQSAVSYRDMNALFEATTKNR